LDISIFLKKKTGKTEIDTKSSHNAYEMRKLANFMTKKLIFGQTYMKFAVAMDTSKMMDTQLTYHYFREG